MAKNSPISTFILRLVKAALAAVVVILCSRWLNADGRGELSVILFWLHVFVLFFEIVGGSTVANLIREKPIGTIVPAVWVWSILVGLFGAILAAWFTDLPVLWVLLIYFPLAWLGSHFNYYQGLGKVFIRNNLQVILEVLKLAVLLCYYALVPNITVTHVLVVYAIAHFMVYTISRFILREFFSVALKEKANPPKSLFSFGLTNQTAAIFQFLTYRVGVVLLASYVSDAEAGVFSNVLLVADTVWIFANSFGTIAHMKILATKNQNYIGRVVSKYVFISVFGTLMACAVLSFIPSGLYISIFGEDFGGMRNISLAAIPGILALSFSTVMAHYLHAVNQFKLLVISALVGLLAQLLAHALLLLQFKGVGAGLAFSAGLIVSAFLIYLFSAKKLKNKLQFNVVYEMQLIKKMIKIMFSK